MTSPEYFIPFSTDSHEILATANLFDILLTIAVQGR